MLVILQHQVSYRILNNRGDLKAPLFAHSIIIFAAEMEKIVNDLWPHPSPLYQPLFIYFLEFITGFVPVVIIVVDNIDIHNEL